MTSGAIDAITYMRDMCIIADTDAASRIYPSVAPQSVAYPFVVLEIISREETPTQDSGSAVDTYRIQLDVFAQATTAKSAFTIAHEVAQTIRETISRSGDELNYDNAIDSVQEADHRTDYIPDLAVYNVQNDYFVRVKPSGNGDVTQPVPIVDDGEQVYGLRRWLNGELIYWRTWYFAAGNDDLNTLTGLDPDDVALLLPMNEMRWTVGADENTSGVEVTVTGGVYKVFLASDQSEIYITLYYTKV